MIDNARVVEHGDPEDSWHVEYDTNQFRISTGSGGMGTYWKTAFLFATDMLNIEPV